MAKVRLSGTVSGSNDTNRETRARMLYLLFANGWDIYNSNGDQQITLSNIEKKIKESDAFVFMPGATLEDLFQAVSIFVGYQTLDKHLFGKAAVVLNSGKSWTPLFELLDSLQELGTIRQSYRKFLLQAKSPEEVIDSLETVQREGVPDVGREKMKQSSTESYDTPLPDDHVANVCVFCSASIEDPAYLEDGYQLGKSLAENNYGCVSGAGTTGVMGAVVRGSVEAGGWTGGSNVPHIIEIEGLPDGLSSFWLKPDIYTRMEVMIENSDSFVIFPGGAGTVQELLALLIFKKLGSPLMKDKPVIIYNRPVEGKGIGFWDKLVSVLKPFAEPGFYQFVDSSEELMKVIKES
ncbi:LOG family protein [Puniceicoccaceae bacterium K14]|nr:LOG family protein [Puniceicoccaceae bacterium K14]